MDFKQLNNRINLFLNKLSKNVTFIANFVTNRLKIFAKITLAEQIAYSSIAAGILLVFISIILFIL